MPHGFEVFRRRLRAIPYNNIEPPSKPEGFFNADKFRFHASTLASAAGPDAFVDDQTLRSNSLEQLCVCGGFELSTLSVLNLPAFGPWYCPKLGLSCL